MKTRHNLLILVTDIIVNQLPLFVETVASYEVSNRNKISYFNRITICVTLLAFIFYFSLLLGMDSGILYIGISRNLCTNKNIIITAQKLPAKIGF